MLRCAIFALVCGLSLAFSSPASATHGGNDVVFVDRFGRVFVAPNNSSHRGQVQVFLAPRRPFIGRTRVFVDRFGRTHVLRF